MTELSLRLQTSNSQSSRVRKLEKGILQDSVLVPMLINIYIHDFMRLRLAEDLAILLSQPSLKAAAEGEWKDMNIQQRLAASAWCG
ncbi:hypothetical protein NQZ68_008352 [Dissostichus eleginoides]|nr:hypothetical protein NQZ68_008352 [Dissostichus eleginoides]